MCFPLHWLDSVKRVNILLDNMSLTGKGDK